MSDSVYTDTKRTVYIHSFTVIHLYTRRLKKIDTKCMHLCIGLLQGRSKNMALSHASTAIHLYISVLLGRHQMHGHKAPISLECEKWRLVCDLIATIYFETKIYDINTTGSFCFMSWCLKFFCAVGALCMFSYF